MSEKSKKIEVEDRIQKTDGEDEETILDFLAQYEVYGYLKKWWCIWYKNLQGWERRSSGKFTILLVFHFFCASVDIGRFLFLNNMLQAWDPPTFKGFFDLLFPTKRTFEPTVLLVKKAARCHPFLAVVRCLFHTHLWLKCSRLLNVYINCRFEISSLASDLFFSLFELGIRYCIVENRRERSSSIF